MFFTITTFCVELLFQTNVSIKAERMGSFLIQLYVYVIAMLCALSYLLSKIF